MNAHPFVMALAVAASSCASKPPRSCVDTWLQEHGLNSYGDPPDTVYAGGNPTFDEASGKSVSREEWVFQHHPDARKACAR